MKVVILAGGKGTRLAEETSVRPKPMVEVGGKPILWHIMNIYNRHGLNEFVVALGYKGDIIRDFFLGYHPLNTDVEVDLRTGKTTIIQPCQNDWKVRLCDTGDETLTGGRLHRLESQIRDGGTFLMTYGDGVSDVDITKLIEYHRSHGKIATLTAVRPPARFGTMVFKDGAVTEFKEKPQTGEGWINGGFFVFEPEIFDYLHGDNTVLELDPLERLSADGQLMAYKHDGFWQCMDTLRDRMRLEELWTTGNAPWHTWRS